ncbi:MAG: hypothetical protein MUF27_17045 [Acidobacteria bacterium]|nr:hypothetical protein [Acidobacteriota bacterium]
MSDGEQNSPDHGHVPLNLAFAEVLYEDWQRDPLSVPEDWREYFGGLPAMGEPARPGPSFRPPSLFHPTKDACETCAVIRQERTSIRSACRARRTPSSTRPTTASPKPTWTRSSPRARSPARPAHCPSARCSSG